MKLDRGTALISTGALAVVASGWCWTTVPATPYVPNVEGPGCTAAALNGCTTYYVPQQGDVCAHAFPRGAMSCTDFMANRPVMEYRDGWSNSAGCCTGGPFVRLHPTLTTPTPLAVLGLPGCIIAEPGPE